MANTEARIDVVVKGGSRLERLIKDVSRLESVVDRINVTPLDINVGRAESDFNAALQKLTQARKGVADAQKAYKEYDKTIKKLEKSYLSAEQASSSAALSEKKSAKEKGDALLKAFQAEKKFNEGKKERLKLEKALQREERNFAQSLRYKEEAKNLAKVVSALSDLSGEYLKLGRFQTRTPVTGKVAATQTRGTIAQLNAQAEALSLVAANSEIATRQFRQFTIASEIASQNISSARQEQFRALAMGLTAPARGEALSVASKVGSQKELAGARALIGEVIASYGGIVKSEAALSSYIGQLRSLQSIVPFDTSEWGLLETSINEVNAELEQLQTRYAGLRGQSSDIAQAVAAGIAQPQGEAMLLPQFSVKSAAEKARYERDLASKQDTQIDKLIALQDRLKGEYLEQGEAVEIRNKFEKIASDTAEGLIDSARRQTVELKRQVKEIKDRNKVLRDGTEAAVSLGRQRLREESKTEVTTEKIDNARKKLDSAAKRINISSEKELINEVQKKNLLLDLDKARLEIDQGRLIVAQTIVAETDRLRRLEEVGNRAKTVRSRGSYRSGIDSPVEGRKRVESAVLSSQILERKLVAAKEKGLSVSTELAAVQDAINVAASDNFENTRKTLGLLLSVNENAAKRLRLEQLISEEQEKRVGNRITRGGEALSIDTPRRLKNKLASGAIVEQGLINLQAKGVDVTEQLISLQKTLNDAKRDDFQISERTLGNLEEQVTLAGKRVTLENRRLAGKRGGGGTGDSDVTGFSTALSPAEIRKQVNQIYKDFDKAVAGNAGEAGENVTSTFASNLKKGIPNVIAASTSFASASIDAILKKFGMRSPSRVMIEIARNLVDTYVNVLEAAIPEIQQASKKAFAAPTNLDVAATRLPKSQSGIDAMAEFIASIIDPMQSRGLTAPMASAFAMRKGQRLDLWKIPGLDMPAAETASERRQYNDPNFQKLRQSIVEFYNIPSEFAPDVERATAAAGESSESAKRLEAEVADLVSGLGKISNLFQKATDLIRVPVTPSERAAPPAQQKTTVDLIDDYWSSAAANAEELDKKLKLEFSEPGAANTAALVDFWDTALDDAQKIVKKADEVAAEGGLGGAGAGGAGGAGGGGGFGGGGGGGGAAGGAAPIGPQSIEDLEQALRERRLGPIARATNDQLEELARRLQEIRNRADATGDEFRRLGRDLAVLGREQERRDPGAELLTRSFGPRTGRAISEGLVGGAFPLLFGQGIGSSIFGGLGGAAGGFAGGGLGFGLSLLGTALGSVIDETVQKSKTLGAALNESTADIDAIVESLGEVGGPSARLIKQLEEVAGKQAALEEATARLALIVGDDGVKALQEFGDASTELGNALARVTSQVLAETAKLLEPITSGIAGQVESVSLRRQAFESSDPRITSLRAQIGDRMSPRNEKELAVLREIERVQKEINEEATRSADKALESRINALSPINDALASEERRYEIARLGGDILKDEVMSLEKTELLSKLRQANQETLNKLLDESISYYLATQEFKKNQIAYDRELLELTNKRAEAEKRAADEAKRKAEQAEREAKRKAEEAARAQEQTIKQLNAAVINAYQGEIALMKIRQETLEFEQGSLAALERRLKTITLERDNEIKILDIKYRQTANEAKTKSEALTLYKVYLDQRTVLAEQYELEYDRTLQRRQQLQVERELLKIQAKQATSAVSRDIERQISDVQRGVSFPFGGEEAERLDLLVAQERRREDALRSINDQLNEQNLLREAAAPGEKAEFDIRIKGLQDQLALYKRLLPQLDAVEQAQLRQNQLMEKYGFLSSELSTAMSAAVQSVVTGTGTVEEAFATMFQNIGRAFVDMATQMLAQKLFMTVLSAFGAPALNFSSINQQGAIDIGRAASFDGGGYTGYGSRTGGIDGKGGFPAILHPRETVIDHTSPKLFTPSDIPNIRSNDSPMRMAEAGSDGEQGGEGLFASGQTATAQLPFTRSAESLTPAQAMQAAGPIDVRYESQVINVVEYVTAEQHRKGVAEAAERGRALTLDAIFNSPKVRRKAGL